MQDNDKFWQKHQRPLTFEIYVF